MMKKIILLLMLLQFQLSAHAGGMTVEGTIDELAFGPTILRLVFSEQNNANNNPDGCPNAWAYVVDLSQNNEHTKRVYASLLAAKLQNKKIKFWLSGCMLTPWGGSSLPIISEINFVPEN